MPRGAGTYGSKVGSPPKKKAMTMKKNGKTLIFDLGVAPKIHCNYPDVNKLLLN